MTLHEYLVRWKGALLRDAAEKLDALFVLVQLEWSVTLHEQKKTLLEKLKLISKLNIATMLSYFV